MNLDIETYTIIVKSFTAGVLSAYLLLYGLRPSVMYPDIVLEFFENKWIILVLLLINYYLFIWDKLCGALLLLCIIALIFDYVVFIDNHQNPNKNMNNPTNQSYSEIDPTFVPVVKSVDLVTGTFQENMMNQLNHNFKHIYKLQDVPSSFI